MLNLFKKSFLVDYDDPLTYPSAQAICKAIEKYCVSAKQKCQFVSTEKPVTFYSEDKLYVDIISMCPIFTCISAVRETLTNQKLILNQLEDFQKYLLLLYQLQYIFQVFHIFYFPVM